MENEEMRERRLQEETEDWSERDRARTLSIHIDWNSKQIISASKFMVGEWNLQLVIGWFYSFRLRSVYESVEFLVSKEANDMRSQASIPEYLTT